MASTTAVCTAFLVDLATKQMDFTVTTGDVIRWTLHTSTETFGAGTTAFSATNEVAGTGYTTRGFTTANITPVIDTATLVFDWLDPTWSTSTITAASTLLWNDTSVITDASIAVWDFGGDQVSSGGDFILVLPAAAAATGILTIA